ncbi:MutS-related protein [Xanthovirga aplysinae]|uniref:MutS-related protein n=1 Tax=Xanthovirga aplysinae TaxID=2529853 RepID=UPI0012BBC759|nr:hypothetical protein [Xanthovirga aplysinae]MTI33051.1 hypothetical protein [Xanthovirga aplysinae]
MHFEIDEQTYNDLQIFGDSTNQNSILKVFAQTQTRGGAQLIEQMLRNPLSDLKKIEDRLAMVRAFIPLKKELLFEDKALKYVQFYLNMGYPLLHLNFFSNLNLRINNYLRPISELYNIHAGIVNLIKILKSLKKELPQLSKLQLPTELLESIKRVEEIINDSRLSILMKKDHNLKLWSVLKLDPFFRETLFTKIRFLQDFIYEIDAYQTLAKVGKENDFCIPHLIPPPKSGAVLEIEGLFHPLLEQPVSNNVSFDQSRSLCFISGPNMAGKSTFLKSLGVAVYLAHLGFPVPAKTMRCSVFNGIISTINVNDSIEKGYSHFYSEVDRIKTVVSTIKEHGNLLVIFDELFRGTNVKDALEGSVMISKGLAELKTCKIFISTHIIEVIEQLEEDKVEMLLYYFEALSKGKGFKYDYKIKEGYSSQRLGLKIIQNERIFELLEEVKN